METKAASRAERGATNVRAGGGAHFVLGLRFRVRVRVGVRVRVRVEV